MVNIDPREIKGPWDKGFVLDKHTVSSTMIGYNEFGHPEFDTLRSPLGELVYRLKYKNDLSAVSAIAETVAEFLKSHNLQIDVIIPVPPSRQRLKQPLFVIAEALGKLLGVPTDTTTVSKAKRTPQMKDIGDYSERVAVLKDAFTVGSGVENKVVLVLDDLLQSGATMNVVADLIKARKARAVYALALTRTRG